MRFSGANKKLKKTRYKLEMHQFSDSDTPDSDDGRRFKTETTRPKKDVSERNYTRYRSPSPRRRNYPEKRRKSRSRSPNRYDRDRNKRRSDERYKDESRRYSRYEQEGKEERKRREINLNKDKKEEETIRKIDKDSNCLRKCEIRKKVEEKKSYGISLPPKSENSKDGSQEKDYGPILPPKSSHSKKISDDFKQSESNEEIEEKIEKIEETGYGPSSSNDSEKLENIKESEKDEIEENFGPALPPNLLINTKTESIESYGPSLPPSTSSKNQSESKSNEKVIGPSLPEHLRETLAKASENVINFEAEEEIDENEENKIKSEEEQDDDEIIGPLPPNMLPTKSQIELEERALQIKINNLTGESKEKKREEWMMELPEVKAVGLGLGPRQFRANPGPDMSDRSSWTDTPEDKIKKQSTSLIPERDLKKDAEYKELKRRDEEQEKIIKKHKKSSKRDEKSLLEIHQSKIDKKKGEQVERRPFNREIDLKVNRFDEAQKKAILKKAQLLDDRFSSGQAKYL